METKFDNKFYGRLKANQKIIGDCGAACYESNTQSKTLAWGQTNISELQPGVGCSKTTIDEDLSLVINVIPGPGESYQRVGCMPGAKGLVGCHWVVAPNTFGRPNKGKFAPTPESTSPPSATPTKSPTSTPTMALTSDCKNTATFDSMDQGCSVDSPICVKRSTQEPPFFEDGTHCVPCINTQKSDLYANLGCPPNAPQCVLLQDDGTTKSPALNYAGAKCVAASEPSSGTTKPYVNTQP